MIPLSPFNEYEADMSAVKPQVFAARKAKPRTENTAIFIVECYNNIEKISKKEIESF
jgi:hypothetical protein